MKRPVTRYFVTLWLRRTLPADALGGVLGDLDEEFAAQALALGRFRAELWLLRESCSVAQAYHRTRRADRRAVSTLLRDLAGGLRESVRHMRRAPGYTLLAAGSLALAVTAIVGTAALSDLVLHRPIALVDTDRVHRLAWSTTAGTGLAFSFPELDHIVGVARPVATVSAASLTPALLRIGNTSTQDLVDVVIGPLHAVLGLTALRGRLLVDDDETPGRPRVIVVSERFWRAHMLASDRAIGQQIFVNGLDYTVVGVAPTIPSLGFFGVSAAGWVPASSADSLLSRGWRTDHTARAFVALARTIGPDGALDTHLATASGDLARMFPEPWRDRRLSATEGLLVTGNLRRVAVVIASLLSALAALLLVVAATNVAGLVFAQASTRRRAMAIKAALGARPATLVAGTLAEGALLGVLAGAGALCLYRWCVQLVQTLHILPTVTWQLDLPWDGRVVLFTGLVSITAGLATTFGPAFAAARLASARSLDSLNSRQAGDRRAGRLRRWLLGAQVAAAVVLIACATLFTRSLSAIGETAIGIDVDRLAAFDLDIEPAGVPPDELPALANAALERVGALPGVASVAMASRAPVDQSTPAGDVRAVVDSREIVLRDVTRLVVTPEYFDTVGLRLLDGRLFSPTDASRPLVVVNETLAQRLAGTRSFTDLGSGQLLTVVGVVSNARYRAINEPPQPHFYSSSSAAFHMTMLVRAHADPAGIFRDVQRTLDRTGPGIQGFFPRTGRDHLLPVLLPTAVSASVARVLGGVAAGLAAIGLFGLLSWIVHARQYEWELRVALGATARDLRRLVIAEAWQAAWPGTAAGIAGSALIAWYVRGQLYGVTALDPALLTVVPAAIVAVVLIASWLPARRAAAVKATTLRVE